MHRTEAEFHRVKQLVGNGLSDYKVAELTGIPRGTVLRWRWRDEAPYAGRLVGGITEWQVNDAPAYCYLLGRIFTEHCELLGIRVTQSNHRNLTVSHRRSVPILEELVGTKR